MIYNCFESAWQHRGSTVNRWGKDQTGLIEYKFNNQGFRSLSDYDLPPEYAFFGNSIVFGIGVPIGQIMTSFFKNSHNYGLAGNYMNHHSVENLHRFVNSDLYNVSTKIAFFWIDRDEPIELMIDQVNQMIPHVLHISSGQKRKGAVNLMPHSDQDVSGTHPGPDTHHRYARTIQLLFDRA